MEGMVEHKGGGKRLGRKIQDKGNKRTEEDIVDC